MAVVRVLDKARVMLAAAVAAALFTVVLLLAPAALAVPGPPTFGEHNSEAHATRAWVEVDVHRGELETHWQAEYSTSESGPWTAAGSGTFSAELAAETAFASIGESFDDSEGHSGIITDILVQKTHVLRGLVPNTTYYARFRAENADGVASPETIQFKTLPISPPQSEPDLLSGQRLLVTPTTVSAQAFIETNGAQTEYHFEYAPAEADGDTPAESSASWKLFTSGATGTVTVAEDFAQPVAQTTGLSPETAYYLRVSAGNAEGKAKLEGPGVPKNECPLRLRTFECDFYPEPFTTPTARPVVQTPTVRNVTATSARIAGTGIITHGSKTLWRFESAPSALGPWMPVPGGEGTISQAEAEAEPGEGGSVPGVLLSGLTPAGTYYVRVFAENGAGEGEVCHEQAVEVCETISTTTYGIASFQTEGPPTATAFATHSLGGETVRVIGVVNPNSQSTSAEQSVTIGGAPTGGSFTLTFMGQTTGALPYNAAAEVVGNALRNLPNEPAVAVEGADGGPYTVFFHSRSGEISQPLIEGNASGLTPSGTVTVATVQQGGEAYDAHYRFEYIAQKDFEAEKGFAGAGVSVTPEVDVGSGVDPRFVAADLPGLGAGETYRYRVLVGSNFPGNPVIRSGEQALTVPGGTEPGPVGSCGNEGLRSGASAHLPDCRAYELLTPTEKRGSQEAYNYGAVLEGGAAVGEDGDHLMLESPAVQWGAGPGAGQSPYFFSRAANGWKMVFGSPQPETGVNRPAVRLLDPDLFLVAFESEAQTSPSSASASPVEYKAGPPGGPYVTVASVPHKQAPESGVGEGWVAASGDFSKLILAVKDRTLAGHSTTKSGDDLYEYSGGELRQVNAGVGTCGAKIAQSNAGGNNSSSPRVLSSDGSRVFFEAVPGSDCSEPSHLYMRVYGEETLDIGAYRFLAANSEGSRLLLAQGSGVTEQVFLYDTETRTAQLLSGARAGQVSGDFNAIYFESTESLTPDAPAPSPDLATGDSVDELANVVNIYRYDIPTETLSFLAQSVGDGEGSVSPDGRYYYFASGLVGGVPGEPASFARTNGTKVNQVYRYDNAEHLLQCISCASPFDPEPTGQSSFAQTGLDGGAIANLDRVPRIADVSADGDYVFFNTTAALVPGDLDGEEPPAGPDAAEQSSQWFSLSSDVYEWRKPGIGGCAHLQGCLALITNGRGGYQSLFLGTADEGRDAFFYTHEKLVPQDEDTTGNIYDARIEGGFSPPPPGPVECEGDACSTPASAPNDATPSSLTFSGAGNLPPVAAPAPKATKPKPKKKVKPKKKTRKKRGKPRKKK